MKKYFFTLLVLVGIFLSSGLLYAQSPAAGSNSSGRATISNPLGSVVDVRVFVANVLTFVAKIAAVFAVLSLIYVGFLYVQARGNEKKLGDAHKAFKYTIIGIILLLGAQLIASVITGTIEAVTK